MMGAGRVGDKWEVLSLMLCVTFPRADPVSLLGTPISKTEFFPEHFLCWAFWEIARKNPTLRLPLGCSWSVWEIICKL